jgi:hypothetical protein
MCNRMAPKLVAESAWRYSPHLQDNALFESEALFSASFGRGPLRVKSGRDALKFRCPLYPGKQTLVE